MIELYTPRESLLWRQKASRALSLICGLFAASVLIGVLLCFLAKTRTAVQMQWIAVAQSTILGWIAIVLTALVYRPARAEASHMEGILAAGEPVRRSGLLTLTNEMFSIPKSIPVRKLTLRTESAAGEELQILNMDASRVSRLPSASFPAEVSAVRSFITAFRPLDGSGAGPQSPSCRRPSLLRRLASLIPMLIVWALLSLLIWCWIFSLVTDASPARKVTLYVDGQVIHSTELAAVLEEALPSGIRLVQVRPFSYFMMNGDALREGDLFILPESGIPSYRDWLASLPSDFGLPEEQILYQDGIPLGLSADSVTLSGVRPFESDSVSPQRWFLCFGNHSLHLPGNPDAVDDAAAAVAAALLSLR